MKKVLVLVLVSFIAACGFEPLYVEKKTEKKWYFGNEFDVTINDQMEKIKIESINGRFGQKLRNRLIDLISPAGAGADYEYKLYTIPEDVSIERQALRKDITATRERARYKVVYYMTDRAGNELVRGDSIAFVSYDIMSNPYSTTMAQKKAESDAANIISNDMTLRIGAYFHAQMDVENKKMIFRQAQIDKFLKQPDKNLRCVLLYGANEGLITENVKLFAKTVVEDINDAFRVTYLNGSDVNSDFGMLSSEYNSQSLMGGRRVVIVRDVDNNLTKHLKKLFAESNSDTLLILTSEGLNRKASLVSLAEEDNAFACVPCYEDKDEDIYSAARSFFITNKITISNEALQLLCSRLSNDRKSSLSEIDKLVTYIGERRNVVIEDIMAVISDVSASSVEDVCYFTISGDFEKSQKAYLRLLNENIEPISVVRSLYYHFDKMLTVRASIEQGQTLDRAVSSLVPRIIFYRENAFKRQASIWSKEKILGAFDFLYKCERDCKTTHMPTEEIVGQTLLNIAQAASRFARN